jgi:hypothetical protein
VTQRARWHLSVFRRLAPGDKLAYVLWRASALKVRVELSISKLAHQSCRRLGLALPHALPIVRAANDQANRAYVAQPYPGRVTLFRAGERPVWLYPDRDLGWGGLAAGGLEVHEVPGDHETVIKEPYIRLLAEKLKVCLDNAQSDVSARSANDAAQ